MFGAGAASVVGRAPSRDRPHDGSVNEVALSQVNHGGAGWLVSLCQYVGYRTEALSSFLAKYRVNGGVAMAAHFVPFIHRLRSGTVDSICTRCYRTIAKETREDDLAKHEWAHHCDGLDFLGLLHPDILQAANPAQPKSRNSR
jgi:hypothetical protein